MNPSLSLVSKTIGWNDRMIGKNSRKFIIALQEGNLPALWTIPKADLHNHFVWGGAGVYPVKNRNCRLLMQKQEPLYDQ